MIDTIAAILELQPLYSPDNTSAMQRRGYLVRRDLAHAIRALGKHLSQALGKFGHDFHVGSSDGTGRKTELPWVRFCSKGMSPKPTQGFYCILHFSTDGSAAHVTLGCGSSTFRNGSFITLPGEELDRRTEWAKHVIQDTLGSLEPFSDVPDFGARRPLPRSFQRATALCKRIDASELATVDLESLLVRAADFLRILYQAELDGRELSPADSDELALERQLRPARKRQSQGIGLSSIDRRIVELHAMDLVRQWLSDREYRVVDTSGDHPYDFVARRGSEELIVEVKGTTSDNPVAILMTRSEVRIHRAHKPKTALFIVSRIRLVGASSQRRARGGTLEALVGWDIDTWCLTPTTFRVKKPD